MNNYTKFCPRCQRDRATTIYYKKKGTDELQEWCKWCGLKPMMDRLDADNLRELDYAIWTVDPLDNIAKRDRRCTICDELKSPEEFFTTSLSKT